MRGKIPFYGIWTKNLLKKNFKKKKIKISDNLNDIKKSKYILVCIGTLINSKLKPDLKNFFLFYKCLKKKLIKIQIFNYQKLNISWNNK